MGKARWLLPLLFWAACAPGDPDGTDAGGEAREGDSSDDSSAEAAWEADGGPDVDAGDAWVRIVFPGNGTSVANPVTFVWSAGADIATVTFDADGWPLNDVPLPADAGTYSYTFTAVNVERRVVLTGYDATGLPIAVDEVLFTPTEDFCGLPDQPGFNHYTVEAINDWDRYPRDETYPYCWEATGDVCGENWGMVYDGWYGGAMLFPGGGDCFCSGHTLEMFLRAYRLWQRDAGVAETTTFRVGASELTIDEVDIGGFYQHWQGFGVASEASAANAFASVGIGEVLPPERWDEALPGDYANISRSTGSGHAVIFVGWMRDGGGRIVGCALERD